MPSATFSHSTTVDADMERAWAALQDPTTWSTLAGAGEVKDVVFDDDANLVSFGFEVSVAGKPYPGLARTVKSESPRAMALRIQTSEMEGVIEVELATDSPLRIDVTLELTTKGFLSAMFFPAVSAAVGGGLPRHTEQFADSLIAS